MNIVLAHGIFGFKRFIGVDYFNGVKKFLETLDPSIRVLVTRVSPAGRIEWRGKELGDQILRSLDTGVLDPGEEVHIIAHSMGGLDARFCLSPFNPDNIASKAKVVSLSTISTPHRGSPVADVLTGENLLDKLLSNLPFDLGNLDEFARQIDLKMDGLQDLTTAKTEEFNSQYLNNEHVLYASYAGVGRVGTPTAGVLRPFHSLVTFKTKEDNDGMVAVSSATWGERLIEKWPADHADEIGHDLDHGSEATPTFDYLEKYRGIVERLMA